MRRYVPLMHRVLSIYVVVNANVGITTWQRHSPRFKHDAADTPPPDDTTARPIIADHSQHRRCNELRAPCGHNPPPARSTEATPTPPTATIDRTVNQKSRYVGRRTTTTTRPFSSSSLTSSSRSSCARSLQPVPPTLLVTAAMPPTGGDRGDSGAGRSVELMPWLQTAHVPAESSLEEQVCPLRTVDIFNVSNVGITSHCSAL